MSYTHHETCPYCDTEYTVEFYDEDDILMHCPACGSELPSTEEEEVDMDPDGGFWDE